MSIYKRDEIYGWQNDKTGEFYCVECFDKEFPQFADEEEATAQGWRPFGENDIEDYAVSCDHPNHQANQ